MCFWYWIGGVVVMKYKNIGLQVFLESFFCDMNEKENNCLVGFTVTEKVYLPIHGAK